MNRSELLPLLSYCRFRFYFLNKGNVQRVVFVHDQNYIQWSMDVVSIITYASLFFVTSPSVVSMKANFRVLPVEKLFSSLAWWKLIDTRAHRTMAYPYITYIPVNENQINVIPNISHLNGLLYNDSHVESFQWISVNVSHIAGSFDMDFPMNATFLSFSISHKHQPLLSNNKHTTYPHIPIISIKEMKAVSIYIDAHRKAASREELKKNPNTDENECEWPFFM